MCAESDNNELWKLIREMREKLTEYSENPAFTGCDFFLGFLDLTTFSTDDVIIQQTTLDKILNLSKYDTTTMQEWFERGDLADLPSEGDDSSI